MATTSTGTTIATKLIPPTKRSGIIERRALMARIEQATDRRLLLVCAPAGYGKTSVLERVFGLLRQRGCHAGWISLDESDKDLSRFISYFIEAARRGGLRLGQALTTLFGSGANLPSDTLKTLLLNELSSLEEDLFLFLDDYHLVQDPEIRELVNSVLLSPLRHVHVLIATRTQNDLPVGRLRALDQLYEVEAPELMFSDAEVGEFVENVRGTPISGAQISRLRESTEGWAASLQMAGIALRGVGDVDQFLDGFSGEHKSVGDFLGDEVLRRQPADIQEFLIATSILKRFNSSLCNAVIGKADARALIDDVERRNLFVFSLDPQHEWYRYHHLFSEFLRRRLYERHPELVAEYHRRASLWLAQRRFTIDAIEHAFHANDVARAGELLDSTCSDLFAAGQTATLMSLRSRLPAELLDRLPRLQLECAWYSELSWDFPDASIALQRVQAVLEERKRSDPPDQCPQEMVFLEAKLAHRQMMLSLLSDDMPTAERQAQEWLAAGKTNNDFMCASAGSAVMASSREMYRCEGAATSTRLLHDRFLQGGAFYGIVFHQTIAGATLFARGELGLAAEAYERALQVAVELHGENSALYNIAASLLAELYYERNQLEQAEEVLAQRDIASELGFVDNLMAAYLTSARLKIARGRHDEAERVLSDGAWRAEKYGFARMQAGILNERVRQLVSAKRGKEAAFLLQETHLLPGLAAVNPISVPTDGVTTACELLTLANCRIRIEEGKAQDVVSVLKPWFTFTKSRHCYRSAIRIGALLSRALLATADRRSAQRVLTECLQLGEKGWFVRSFADEGAEVIDALVDLSKSPVLVGMPSGEYVASIIAAADNPNRMESPDAELRRPMSGDTARLLTQTQDTFSQRELQILELGARGMQNLDIAKAVCLAESTVKWYWQRIFDKLDVRRRPDAITRARQLHWIR